jgi:hypothetical protein
MKQWNIGILDVESDMWLMIGTYYLCPKTYNLFLADTLNLWTIL